MTHKWQWERHGPVWSICPWCTTEKKASNTHAQPPALPSLTEIEQNILQLQHKSVESRMNTDRMGQISSTFAAQWENTFRVHNENNTQMNTLSLRKTEPVKECVKFWMLFAINDKKNVVNNIPCAISPSTPSLSGMSLLSLCVHNIFDINKITWTCMRCRHILHTTGLWSSDLESLKAICPLNHICGVILNT